MIKVFDFDDHVDDSRYEIRLYAKTCDNYYMYYYDIDGETLKNVLAALFNSGRKEEDIKVYRIQKQELYKPYAYMGS